eukprot:6188172-Pleurochrysis_carterae.AAC.2
MYTAKSLREGWGNRNERKCKNRWSPHMPQECSHTNLASLRRPCLGVRSTRLGQLAKSRNPSEKCVHCHFRVQRFLKHTFHNADNFGLPLPRYPTHTGDRVFSPSHPSRQYVASICVARVERKASTHTTSHHDVSQRVAEFVAARRYVSTSDIAFSAMAAEEREAAEVEISMEIRHSLDDMAKRLRSMLEGLSKSQVLCKADDLLRVYPQVRDCVLVLCA